MDYLSKLFKKKVDNTFKVFTSISIPKDTSILKLKGKLLKKPNKYSIQINENLHIDRGFEIDDELIHSCNPNCYIDFQNLELISIREISVNEELTINYCCTEDKLAIPFSCNCESKNCYGDVKGFSFLDKNEQIKLKPYLSPYIMNKYFPNLNK